MARKFKPSERIVLESMIVGAVVGGGIWWLWPGAHWGLYAVIGFIVFAMYWDQALKSAADKAIVDRDWDRDS